MKYIVMLLMGVTLLWSAHIDEYAKSMGYERDYQRALIKAKKEKKPLMLVVVGDYCPWCHKFERRTLNVEPIKTDVATDMVTVIVDKKFDKEHFPESFQTPIIPVAFFINPKNEEQFYESIGYVNKKEFIETLSYVKKEFKALK